MYVDSYCLLSDSQALSATAVSTNTYDQGSPTIQRHIGTGEPVGAVVCVEVAADFTTTDETYRFDLVQSAAAALTTPTVLASLAFIASGSLISSNLTAGYIFTLPIPFGMALQRYIGMNYTLGGTTPSVTVSAFFGPLKLGMGKFVAYAKGYTIT